MWWEIAAISDAISLQNPRIAPFGDTAPKLRRTLLAVPSGDRAGTGRSSPRERAAIDLSHDRAPTGRDLQTEPP
ncbi:MAG: hypothetical protein KF703_17695, partial [Actinobacteria bacterium]|nr:hypothetical protein [Actinomycetota bacterium]